MKKADKNIDAKWEAELGAEVRFWQGQFEIEMN